jgi:hypothetical protein
MIKALAASHANNDELRTCTILSPGADGLGRVVFEWVRRVSYQTTCWTAHPGWMLITGLECHTPHTLGVSDAAPGTLFHFKFARKKPQISRCAKTALRASPSLRLTPRRNFLVTLSTRLK